jgi:hypothetical protein
MFNRSAHGEEKRSQLTVYSNAGTIVLSNSRHPAKTSDRNSLAFYRYGDQYFLAEVWTVNTHIGRQIPIDQRQTKLARSQQKREVALMASEK